MGDTNQFNQGNVYRDDHHSVRVLKVAYHQYKRDPSEHEPDWKESCEWLVFLKVEIFKYCPSFWAPFFHGLDLSSHNDNQGQKGYD